MSQEALGATRGPFQWRVIWGSFLRPGFTQEIVTAYDLDEALSVAHDQRPELFRPHVGFLIGGQISSSDSESAS